jgi:SAM-dependent methyltransferase
MMDDVNSPAKWERDYQRGTAGWDMGTPTPAFQRLLTENNFPPGRLLNPGAGRGHDAREFARHGFEVVALDFAKDAVHAMRDALTPGLKLEILQQDFFQLSPASIGTFDYFLEYTFYCAIDPARRDEYADQVARLLKPNGIYIALAFPLGAVSPTFADGSGPPFIVNADELIARLHAHGFHIVRREFPPDSVKPRKGREELLILQKRDRIAGV